MKTRGLALVCGLALAGAACSRSGLELPRPAAQSRPPPPRTEQDAPDPGRFGRSPDQALADRIDLLFVIDDSGSMADKQSLLADALPDLVQRLTAPLCVDDAGVPVPDQPAGRDEPCPPPSRREFNSVQDMHIGVITTAVGDGIDCSGGFGMASKGHLSVAEHVPTYRGYGFLAWDPDQVNSPPGEKDQERLISHLREQIRVGTAGCAHEAPLEAVYRFLADPEPMHDAPRCGSGLACALDRGLLEERARFLRPDSLLAVLILSDENDCSLVPGPDTRAFLATSSRATRGTKPCLTNPADACCHPCSESAPPGCPPTQSDSECLRGDYTPEEDPPLLRCWDQKRRFGIDRLHPIERYADALREPVIENAEGELVPNPIFSDLSGGDAAPRDPTLVFLGAIVGVPWQALADPTRLPEPHYLTPPELERRGVWDLLLGDPALGRPSADPFMRESIAQRSGTSPITGIPIEPSSAAKAWANPVNGHEIDFSSELDQGFFSDLQYACIFALPSARPCSDGDPNCDCSDQPDLAKRPICQQLDGSYSRTQWGGKAYPGLRALRLVRELGQRGMAASICASNVVDPARPDYGYRPALEALLERMRLGLR